MGVLRRIARKGRSFEVTWRYLFNFAPTLTYRVSKARVSDEAARVLADLNRDGVAITSFAALFGSNEFFDKLRGQLAALRLSQLSALSEARAKAAANETTAKNFIFEYLGQSPPLDMQSVFARFALDDCVLQIANAYLGMHARLRYFNIWHTFADSGMPRQSQLWHRDREDRYILKAFVYLSDVDNGAGPFTYAAGTHGKGKVQVTPASVLEGGVRRTDDNQMAQVVPSKNWISCVGPKGTIVFADTRGYHKGGLARERDRIMYTCMFTSPASESQEFFSRPIINPTAVTKAQAFALAAPKAGAWLSWNPSS